MKKATARSTHCARVQGGIQQLQASWSGVDVMKPLGCGMYGSMHTCTPIHTRTHTQLIIISDVINALLRGRVSYSSLRTRLHVLALPGIVVALDVTRDGTVVAGAAATQRTLLTVPSHRALRRARGVRRRRRRGMMSR